MTISSQLAKHLRDVHFGGNWSTVDLKSHLSGMNWEDAVKSVHSLNSIAAITFHLVYYTDVIIKVLEESKLDGKDELSWITPNIWSQEEWDNLVNDVFTKAEKAAQLIEQLPDEKLTEDFVDPKYGTNYRNIAGIVEHLHYHLGQIVIIRKLLEQ
ncbi:hypothetical protein D3C87_96020 [compost metagenome]